jgi:DNA-binding winged helix-turn-helix (wHTH) protein
MATVVLALGDSALRRLCEVELPRNGHTPLALSRALELLHVSRRLTSGLVLVDDTALGRDAVRACDGQYAAGLGLEHPSLRASLALPVTGAQVVELVERLVEALTPAAHDMSLDPNRRVVRANGREVDLTRTEYQLLDALYRHRGRELTQEEALEAAWGPGDWMGNLGVLRAHVRNLRLKLAQVGLPNAVRSRRGRGYSLVV